MKTAYLMTAALAALCTMLPCEAQYQYRHDGADNDVIRSILEDAVPVRRQPVPAAAEEPKQSGVRAAEPAADAVSEPAAPKTQKRSSSASAKRQQP